MANDGVFTFREWPDETLEGLKAKLATRTSTALAKSEIPSLSALVNRTERQALAAKGIGRKSLAELRTALGAIGLRFGMRVVSFAGGPLDGQPDFSGGVKKKSGCHADFCRKRIRGFC